MQRGTSLDLCLFAQHTMAVWAVASPLQDVSASMPGIKTSRLSALVLNRFERCHACTVLHLA